MIAGTQKGGTIALDGYLRDHPEICMADRKEVHFFDYERERCALGSTDQHRIFSYCDRGFYSEQLERIWGHFSKEQTLILKSEWLRDSPTSVLATICGFLGVSQYHVTQTKILHTLLYE